ncbi:lymphocyte cytosolic 2-like isoform X1 [Labeo rohita]|uniref:Protein Wnt n=1 Tax=Labeo rohita TaxID=84645 RepID=A0A498MMD6_LABRO|nr:lymphocyte cytosolic 2-like isoform X1 [Labeo rohita]
MRAGNSADNRVAMADAFGSIARTELIYLEDSPDYCAKNLSLGLPGTEGRECVQHGESLTQWERRSCRRLCHECGLRVEERRTEIVSSCNCKFHWCCTVKCENCSQNMTDKDLKKFPTAQLPLITKICRDINQNNKQKKAMFHRFNTQQMDDFPPPPPVEMNVMMGQDMDPRWYVGQMSRGEAEVSLRQMNRDGTFLVRDSSKGGSEQPYTLMVLHQQKVYNIQIRFLGNSNGYSLGTGLNGIENFSSVMEIVAHHMKTPLILIDGMEHGARPHRQCCLMHPAGF